MTEAVHARRAIRAGITRPDQYPHIGPSHEATPPSDPEVTGTKPIRLAFLTPSLNAGGAERQMLLLAATLPKPEFEVRFLLLWERGTWAAEADALGVPVHVLGLRPQDCAGLRPQCVAAAMLALRRYLALTRRVDIVDAWLVPSFTFAGFAQPVARVPVLIAGRRSLLGLYRRKSWFRRAAAAWATRRADAVVANSRAAAGEAISEERIDPSRVHVIPNAVVGAVSLPGERERRRLEWGFGPDDVVVGCVANYKPGKGLEALLETASRLREPAPRVRYVFVGDGPLRERLRADIHKHQLDSVVVLNGKEDDARLLYPAFDIVVQASESEGLPNVVLEAAAAGLAIVATDVGGTGDVVTNETDGLLVPKGDADALTSAIRRLAENPDLRGRLGRAAERRSGDFSPGQLTEKTAALYRRLLRERRRAS